MKKAIGIIILVLVFAFLIGTTCLIIGWKLGLACWITGLLLAIIIVIAMFLISEDGE